MIANYTDGIVNLNLDPLSLHAYRAIAERLMAK
jgi:hypothetical protein